ncbi:hypothetical protein QYE76_000124 [Lolium multiflorum]|uniref:Uncharacterized protein n=1 Tax=Lolium multiflorum TaxID=4521 RepID=A0AAD8Q6Q9_LOLMU|nr:hypothetical protein QYE76_000124 [Lolium multiflorum]
MDIDDETMVQLFTEEQNAQAVRRQQHQLILASMLHVRQPFFVVPRRGGSKPSKRRNINRHRQASAMLLYANYFNDNATHSSKEFWRRFRMNKELFLKMSMASGSTTSTSWPSKIAQVYGLHLNSEVHCCNALSCIWSSSRYSQ